jgi:hypothetical protein
MNKFVFSALAASLISATGFASDTEWPELDRELAALSSAPLTQDTGGPYLSGWLISSFDYNTDAETVFDNEDKEKSEFGFGIPAAAINLQGTVGNGYGYKIGFDFFDTGEQYAPSGTAVGSGTDGGTAGLTDAYGSFEVGDYVDFKFGIFGAPSLRSAAVDRHKTLFLDRSFLGQQQSARDAGLSIGGNFSRVNWEVAVVNGMDGSAEGIAYSGRIDIDVMGKMSDCEGAYGAHEGTNLNIGVVYADDTMDSHDPAIKDAYTQVSADATLVIGGFSVFAEIVDYDENAGIDRSLDDDELIVGNNTPFSAGLSYLFGEEYEVAFRYDDWDVARSASEELFDTTRFNFGFNRYIIGHDVKWHVGYSFGDSKSTATNSADKVGEHGIFNVGLVLGF